MRSFMNILGIVLILFGLGTFTYQRFTYTKQEKIAQIGTVQVLADTEKTVYFPPMLSGLAVVAGIVLVIAGRMSK